MATDTLVHEDNDVAGKDSWSGGKQPFKISYGKLMMWYFLLSDAFTFAGFLIAYGALRFSMPSWPVPDFVFSSFPGGFHHKPLFFVTFMTFVLLFSSFTMVRAVQEGHRENKRGVVFWMILTILGGIGFLSCQAWEWNTLLGKEHMTVTKNPFGTHTEAGVYLTASGAAEGDTFNPGDPYLVHKAGAGHEGDADHGAEGEAAAIHYEGPGEYADAVVDENGYILRKFKVLEGENAGMIKNESLGPRAFGAIFFFVTGFHGFHVLSGVIFLILIMVNAATGLYVKRRNGYEMVEKIGLYWHFVDLVWVFVFLVFYLI
jgi:cytochrome c oxidase subunit 3